MHVGTARQHVFFKNILFHFTPLSFINTNLLFVTDLRVEQYKYIYSSCRNMSKLNDFNFLQDDISSLKFITKRILLLKSFFHVRVLVLCPIQIYERRLLAFIATASYSGVPG